MYLSFTLDTIITDTTHVFHGADLFPAPEDLDFFNTFTGNVSVTAVSGPIDPREDGNITGDGEGFFIGMNVGAYFFLQYNIVGTAIEAFPTIEEAIAEELIAQRVMDILCRQDQSSGR